MATCVDRVYRLTATTGRLLKEDPDNPELAGIADQMRQLQEESGHPDFCYLALEKALQEIEQHNN